MSDGQLLETGASKGVDDLLARLRADGVDAGRKEAAAIVDQATAEAASIRQTALAEAQATREAAKTDADAFRKAGEDALNAAIRDAILDLKIQMTNKFRADLQRLVSRQMGDPEFLRELILELTGKVGARVRGAAAADVLLPAQALDAEAFRENADEMQHGPLTAFVRGLAGDIVREGIEFSPSEEFAAGARVYLKDDDVTVDLSDGAVAELLARHLQPRFRAILEGVVK
ncbi:MAG: hypothetical protein AAGC56_04775 [Pseudomonadota bacterium]